MSLLVAAWLGGAGASVAEAREVGALVGTVVDQRGLPLGSVTVSLGGPQILVEQTTRTQQDGSFQLHALPPGRHLLSFTSQGELLGEAPVTVDLLVTSRVHIQVDLGAPDATVVTVRPADAGHPSPSTSYRFESWERLPLGRRMLDVVSTAPGVAGRIDTSAGGFGVARPVQPSSRGEGPLGNAYRIDGIPSRHPVTKESAQPLDIDAIEAIHVYTAGAPAEFGRATSMFVDVVTKDGSDEHHGSVAAHYSSHAWFDAFQPILMENLQAEGDTIKPRWKIPELSATAGGPVVPGQLWYFAALQGQYDWTLPQGLPRRFATDTFTARGLAKLTWQPAPTLQLRYTLLGDLDRLVAVDPDPTVAIEARSSLRTWAQSHTVHGTFSPSARDTVEIRLAATNNNRDQVPRFGDELSPARVTSQPIQFGNAFAFDLQDANRLGGSLVYQRTVADWLGRHVLRAGADHWQLTQARTVLNTGVTEIAWVDSNGVVVEGDRREAGVRYEGSPFLPCTEPDFSNCAVREYHENVGRLAHRSHLTGLFLQDLWQPIDELTVELGVRLDLEQGRDNDGARPATQTTDQLALPAADRAAPGALGLLVLPAPRLGLAIDPLGNGRIRAIGHIGRYYDVLGPGLWQWANTRSAVSTVRFERANPSSGDFRWTETVENTVTPRLFDPDLVPPHADRLTFGLDGELFWGIGLSARVTASRTRNLLEDVNGYDDDATRYVTNGVDKERSYRAFELQVERRFDERFQLFGSYTLQESWGHAPGQLELPGQGPYDANGNNVSAYLDDIGDRDVRATYYTTGLGGVLDTLKGLGRVDPDEPGFADDAGHTGPLPYHPRHTATLLTSYTAPVGLTVGIAYEMSSGNPWQKRAIVPAYGAPYAFPEGRGSRRMPPVHYLDIRLAQRLDVGAGRSVEASLDVFNLPGFASAITYQETGGNSFGTALHRQAPRSARLGLRFRY
ncbi:MAG: TonB-dependent receptor [Myxococcales bacterium]|nr:TonB-dependent receptor [Myxococcales bacterium]